MSFNEIISILACYIHRERMYVCMLIPLLWTNNISFFCFQFVYTNACSIVVSCSLPAYMHTPSQPTYIHVHTFFSLMMLNSFSTLSCNTNEQTKPIPFLIRVSINMFECVCLCLSALGAQFSCNRKCYTNNNIQGGEAWHICWKMQIYFEKILRRHRERKKNNMSKKPKRVKNCVAPWQCRINLYNDKRPQMVIGTVHELISSKTRGRTVKLLMRQWYNVKIYVDVSVI